MMPCETCGRIPCECQLGRAELRQNDGVESSLRYQLRQANGMIESLKRERQGFVETSQSVSRKIGDMNERWDAIEKQMLELRTRIRRAQAALDGKIE